MHRRRLPVTNSTHLDNVPGDTLDVKSSSRTGITLRSNRCRLAADGT